MSCLEGPSDKQVITRLGYSYERMLLARAVKIYFWAVGADKCHSTMSVMRLAVCK